MMFLETFTTFLQEIIISPDFKTCSASLQQQIKHLLFLANIADTEEWEVVKEEHNMILDDIKKGYISWENAEYFNQWQSKIIQLVNFSPELIDNNVTEDDMKVDNNELNMVRNEVLPNPAKHEDIDSMKTPGNEEDIMIQKFIEEESKTNFEIKEPITLSPNVIKSSVHHEYIQTKVGKNITSKCKHCPMQYPHKTCHMLKLHLRSNHFEVYRKVVISDRNSLRQEECKRQTISHLKEKFARKLNEIKSRNVDKTEDTGDDEKQDLKGTIGGDSVIATKIYSSSVHKEYVQIKFGRKIWSSKCKHCHHKFNHKLCAELKRHLRREHIEVYKRVQDSDRMSLRKQEQFEQFEIELSNLKWGRVTENKNFLHEESIDDEEYLQHMISKKYLRDFTKKYFQNTKEGHKEKVRKMFKNHANKLWKEYVRKEICRGSKSRMKGKDQCKNCDATFVTFEQRNFNFHKYHLFEAHQEIYETMAKSIDDSIAKIKEAFGEAPDDKTDPPDTLEYNYYNEKEYVEEDEDWPEDPLNKARLDYFP